MAGKQSSIGVTRRLPKVCEERLESRFSVCWGTDEAEHDQTSILSLANNACGLIVTPAERIDADTIAALPDTIKVISCFSVGYEHVATEEARARGISITNTPGVLTEATADITWLLILGAARRASEGDRLMRSGHWTGWRPTQLLGAQLSTRTLGIFGMGRIGRAVARRAQGFGMTIVYHSRHPRPDDETEGARYIESADDLMAVSDVLSLHAPLTPETNKFLNRDRIALLPHGAIVINTARGPLVDDDALIEALSDGTVAAAGLDVYTSEPDLDRRYSKLNNVILLPHLGSATVETRQAMGMLAIDNLEAVLAGQDPPYRVA